MGTTGRRISINEYPEHLNPFSEHHLSFQDRRKMLADKLRKNGTWSSKISKRLSRSVSWLEKSWLTAEESQKKTHSSVRTCDEVHKSVYQGPQQTNGLSRIDSYLDICHHEDILPNWTQITIKSNESQIPGAQNCNKPEPKRRKKRPAPLPPIADTKSDSNESNKDAELENDQTKIDDSTLHVTSTATINDDQSTNNAKPTISSSTDEITTRTCQPNSVVEPVAADHEFNDDDVGRGGDQHVPSTTSAERSSAPLNVSSELCCDRLDSGESQKKHVHHEPIGTGEQATDATTATPPTTIADHKQNRTLVPDKRHLESDDQVENTQHSPASSSSSSTKAVAVAAAAAEEDQTLDENANKPRVQSASKSNDGLSMHCNGKAVMV